MRTFRLFTTGIGRSFSLLLLVLAFNATSKGQLVTNYSFSQTSGTFTSLGSGATLLWNANGLDNQVSAALAIPTFYFNEIPYTQLYVSANGFITFGNAPTATNYNPISSAETYAGAISAFGTDLTSRQGPGNSGTRDVRYQQVGDEFVVEWRQVRRKNLDEWFSFQIRLNTFSYQIRLVYGPIGQGPASAITLQPQMGLRGPNNTFASNVINRRVGTGNETWATTLPSNVNNDLMRFTSSAPAKSFNEGQTYIFDPNAVNDCAGVPDGSAFIDECGVCAGGTTGNTPNETCSDCAGVPNGTAFIDGCGDCVGGTTGEEACVQDCLGVFGGSTLPGSPCDDGDAATTLDVFDEDCICTGISCMDVIMELQTDGAAMQTTWSILTDGDLVEMCSGGGYPNNAVITNNCCLPEGCYILEVYDSAGDGMTTGTTGGYILRTFQDNQRIIDNRNNFTDGFTSAISGGQGFCLPIGDDRLIYTSCDKLDWVSNQFIVASMNPAVSAEWVDNAPNHMQDEDSGYEFWFFDPNGSYSFRRFRSHSTSHGYPATGPARAAHLRLNNWGEVNHIPEQVLMNVRVRGRVNGVNNEWGPACRFKVDPVAALCPVTKLMDIPGNQYLSCGQYREFAVGSYVHARPVSGATSYEFRFRLPAEGYEVIRTGSSYFVQLYWTVPPPLVTGSQYEVDVRAFKNGQWCPWGEVCILNIGTAPGMQAGGQNSAVINTAQTVSQVPEFTLWPNPNNGDNLFLNFQNLPAGVEQLGIRVFDLTGHQVMSKVIPTAQGNTNATLAFDRQLSAGVYLISISAGEIQHTQRIIIQP